ncbi:MAG: ArsR family transcriptional regulator [Candidatus Heimdallarchaeota archaeon]
METHIWEFPHEGFYVQLEPNMTMELVDQAVENAGGINQLARVLKVKHVFRVYDYRVCRTSIPLSSLLKLCSLAGDEFGIERLEPHIIAYKGGPNAKPILNPRFPLVETSDLFEFMGHMVGDGGHSDHKAAYANSQETLVQKFLRLLQTVFGEVSVWTSVRKHEAPFKNSFQVRFGMTIVRLLHHIYHVDFRTHTARVPRRLFELHRKFAAAYLKAFGDDEGTVNDAGIQIGSANKELMQDIFDLVQAKFPELDAFATLAETQQPRGNMYHIRFRTGAFVNYRAFIGFTHPEKRKELDQILARRERGWVCKTHGATRLRILELLALSSPLTTKNLARMVNITSKTVGDHLKAKKGLIALGFVRVNKAETGPYGARLFEITERGRNVLQLPSIGLLGSGCAGRTKVEILKTLVGGSLRVKEIGQELGLNNVTIVNYMNGRRRSGKWNSGLLEFGLVERSGEGGRADPYVYSLLEAGRQFLAGLKTLFPALE